MRLVVEVARVGVGVLMTLACSSKSGDAGADNAKGGAGTSAGGAVSGGRSDAGSGGFAGGDPSAGGASAGTGAVPSRGGANGSGGTESDVNGAGGAARSAGGASSVGGTGGTGSGAGGRGGAGGASGNGGDASGTGGLAGSSASGGSGTTMYTLKIEFIGDTKGEISDSLGTFICDDTCTRTLPKNSEDSYRAHPKNGAATYFAGFGDDCTGLAECQLRMDEDKHITVEFRKQTHNFVFLSSRANSTSHRGAASFDVNCNELATNAGINNDSNDAYVAWVSDHHSLAVDRLGTAARGWVRLDGKPVADTLDNLLAGKIFHTIRLDDLGVIHENEIVGTGTLADGTAAPDDCNDWSSNSTGYDFALGTDSGGPTYWTESGTRSCNIDVQFYCFGKNFSEPVTLTPEHGKLIYLSDPYVPTVSVTPDQACAASAPPGTGAVRAMLAYGDKAGSDVLTNGTFYMRPDGQVVGRGAEIAEAAAPGAQATVDNYLYTGIWQAGDGTYLNEADSAVWVGDINITRVSAGECGNFTTTTGSATVGNYRTSGSGFWNQEYGDRYRNCNTPHRFYCVEQ